MASLRIAKLTHNASSNDCWAGSTGGAKDREAADVEDVGESGMGRQGALGDADRPPVADGSGDLLNQSRIPRLSAESTKVVLWSSIFFSASTFRRKIANSSFLEKLWYCEADSRSPWARIA